MAYTLGQAAKATGKSKPTIQRAIKIGKISATKDESGQWQIEPAELHRVYKATVQSNGKESNTSEQDVTQSNAASEVRTLRELLAEKDARIRALETDKEDLRTDRDHWRQQATALLTDQRQPTKPKVVHHFLPWWRRFWKPGKV